MVELKEKTVEELRKMASRKKIEGRSKMNKAQLVRALQKCKTTMKKRKMKGGALSPEDLQNLTTRDYIENPLYLYYKSPYHGDETKGWIKSATLVEGATTGRFICKLTLDLYDPLWLNSTNVYIEQPSEYSFVEHNGIHYLVGGRTSIRPDTLPIPGQV